MKRILIIEDDILVQKMLLQTFERAGFQVVTANNGRIGIRLFQDRSFDVVITDLIMPDMEGIETITKLKKKDPQVKVIAISGGGRNRPEDYLAIAEKLGAELTFTKPLDLQALVQAVNRLVAAY
jgi:DNA-binding NtrC family response regulator